MQLCAAVGAIVGIAVAGAVLIAAALAAFAYRRHCRSKTPGATTAANAAQTGQVAVKPPEAATATGLVAAADSTVANEAARSNGESALTEVRAPAETASVPNHDAREVHT